MIKQTKIVVNCETGVQEEIELTAEEISDLEARRIAFEERQAQEEAEAQAKAEAKSSAEAKLSALGLTPEEIAALR